MIPLHWLHFLNLLYIQYSNSTDLDQKPRHPHMVRLTSSLSIVRLLSVFFLVLGLSQQAFSQAKIINNGSFPRYETLDQRTIEVRFDQTPLAGSSATTQWTVTINGVAVAVNSVILIGGPDIAVRFQPSDVHPGENFIKPGDVVIITYVNTGGTLKVGAVPVNPSGGLITAVNKYSAACSDFAFLNQGLITLPVAKTVDICSPVVEDFTQYQFYMSLRVRNSADWNNAGAGIFNQIVWGDGVTTNETAGQTDPAGVPNLFFYDATAFGAGNPGLIMTTRPVHNFPATLPGTGGDCSWNTTISPAFGLTGFLVCAGLTQQTIFKTYDTDNKNTGMLNLPPTPLPTSNLVCLGTNVNMKFSDNTLLNCRSAVEPLVANEQIRYIRITYGSRNYAGGNIPDIRITLPAALGGATKTITNDDGPPSATFANANFFPFGVGSADANGVITLPANVTVATATTYMAQIFTLDPSKQAVGQRFYIKMEYWDVCNQYDALDPVTTLPLAESIENYVEIVTKAPPPTFTPPPTFCENLANASYQLSVNPISGLYSYRWYSTFPLVVAGDLEKSGTTFNPITEGTPLISKTPAASTTTNYFLTAILSSNGCESLPTPVPFTINKLVVPGSITIPGTLTICDGDTPAAITNNVLASGGDGTTYTYQWQRSDNGGAFVNTGAASTLATGFTVPTLTGFTTVAFRRQVSSGACAPAVSNVITYTLQLPVTAGTIGNPQTLCGPADPGIITNVTAPTQGGGAGTYTFVWQSATAIGGPYANIALATASTYDPPAGLNVTTFYRRIVTSGVVSGACTGTATSAPVQVKIDQAVVPGTIGNAQSICAGVNPTTLTSLTLASGGDGVTYTYQWQSAPAMGGPYTNIGGATLTTYDPPVLPATTFFQRVVSSGACTLQPSNIITVQVNPLPTVVSATGGGAVCSGNPAPDIVFTLSGTPPFTLDWSITGPASPGATGFVVATNTFTITAPVTAGTYKITALTDFNGCVAIPAALLPTASVTVGGTAPDFATGPTLSIPNACDAGAATTDPNLVFTLDALSASTVGFTLLYKVDGSANRSKIFATNGASAPTTTISFSDAELNNVGPHIVKITSLQSAAGCQKAFNIDLPFTVRPIPVLVNPQTKIICSGAAVNYQILLTPANTPAGTTFTWPAPTVSAGPLQGTSGAAVPADPAGTLHITDILTNTTGANITVTYAVTPTSSLGCPGTPRNVVITVRPEPVLVTPQTKTICSGANTNYEILLAPVNAPAGTTFSWPAPVVSAGPAQGSAGVAVVADPAGTKHISQVLTNTTGASITVTYTITPTSSFGCVGAARTVVITVDPAPIINAGQVKTICSGAAVNLEVLMAPLNTPPGTRFNWPVPTVSSGPAQGTAGVNVNADPAGTSHITDILTNTTGSNITVTYNVTPTGAAGCVGIGRPVVITVQPAPKLVTPQAKTICSGTNTSYEILLTPANLPAGTTFSWADPDGAGPGTAQTNVPMGVAGTKHINDLLTNFTSSSVSVIYSVTPTSGAGCVGVAQDVTITVNPLPVANAVTGPGTVCANATTTLLYQVTPNLGSTYAWTVPAPFVKFAGGTSADFFVLVRFPVVGSGNIQMIETNSFGCTGSVNVLNVTAANAPGALSINGLDPVCKNQTGLVYTIPAGVFTPTSTYTWTASGASITSAASGPGLQSVTLDFGLSPAATLTVSETSSSGCSGTPFTKNITVADRPSMTSTNTNTICSGTAPTLIFAATLPSTFDWIITGIIGAVDGATLGQAGSGNLSSTFTGPSALSNTSGAVGSVTFDVTPTATAAPGCEGPVQSVSILVNPESVLITPQVKTICSGQSANYEILLSPANLPAGTTFSWAAPVMSDASVQGSSQTSVPMGALGTKHILDVLTNTTGTPITATYTISATSGAGCVSNQSVLQRQAVITINPQPILSVVADIVVCPGQTIGPINFSANTLGGETFSWTNDNALIGVTTSGIGNIPAYAAPVNSSGSNIVGNLSVTATKNGCTSTPVTFKVTIKPQPVVTPIADITVCPGQTIGPINFVANSGGGETFNWTNTNPAVGVAISGIGNIPSYIAPSNLTGVAIVGDFSVTAVKNGCTSTPVTFKVTIKPEPVITAVSSITVCPGQTIGPINFSANTGGGETFNWINDNTAVGLAGSGVGNIVSYTAPANGTGSSFVANVTVTTSKNGCSSAPLAFQITVKPQPVMSAITDITVCPGSPIGPLTFVANTGGGETFNWTNDNAAIGIGISGSGNIAAFTAPVNVSGGNFVGNFSVTATLNGCVSAPVTFKVTVKPTPVINPVTSAVVCPAATVGPFTFSANTGGSESFTWTNDNTLVGLAGSGTGNIPSFAAASNLTGSNQVANISVTATKNGCASSPFIFQITVKPQPVLVQLPDLTDCPGQSVGPINFTANTGGSETFNWTNDNTTVGLAGSGSGGIPAYVAPPNLTGSDFVANMSVTATKNGCVSSIMTFKITIKPQPVVTAIADITKCPGQSVGPVSFVANTGGSEVFNWTNDNPAIGLAASGVGNISSYLAPANLTGSPNVANISVTAVKNGCTSAPKTFIITINPQPVMNPVTDISVCPGQTVGPVNFAANTGGGESFSWTNSNTAVGLPVSGMGSIASYLAPANVTGSAFVGTISVNATLNGCTSLAGTFTITIKPQPIVSPVTNITVCPGATVGPVAFTANSGGGETFNWANSNTGIGLVAGGAGNITSYVAPANVTGAPIVGNISVTATKNGCTSSPVVFQITISPQPVINNISNTVACPGQIVGPITFTSNTGGGESYTWTNSNTAVGLLASGVGNIASYTAPANLTGSAFVATISVTATLNTCVSSPVKTFTITINPQPVVTSVANVSVCPGATVGPFTFAANSGGGETFAWTNTNAAIGLGVSGTGNIPSWVAPANLTGNGFVGTINVTATKNGCTSAAMVYTVTIKPQPVVSAVTNITVCPGDPIGPINFAANTGGAETFNWTNSNTAVGLAAAGTGDISSYLAPANVTGAAIVSTVSVTATKATCVSTPMVFTITVKPQPVVTTVLPISVCPGQTIGPISFAANTGGSETFDWSNSNTAIGLAGSGSGNIAAFAAPANLTGTAFVGNISVTAIKNGCISSAMVFTITVEPTPVVSNISDISVCPGQTVGPIAFTANTSGGETFNWTNNNTTVGLAAVGVGNIASYVAPANVTGSDLIAIVSVTATKNGCTSVAKTFQITIKAVPVITAQAPISVCTGATIGPINFAANTGGGETFTWTNTNTTVGIAGSGAGNIAAFTSPSNTSNVDFVGTITVTASKATCVSATMQFTVTVKPKPVVSSSLDITRCSSQVYGLNLNTDGVSIGASNYDITAVVQGGLVGAATTGLARPANAIFNDVFANTTASPLTVTYTVTPHGTNGCTGDAKVITFIVNPEPVLFNPGVPAICSKDITNIVLGTNGTSVAAASFQVTTKVYSIDNGVTFTVPVPANFVDAGNAGLNTPGSINIIKNDSYTNTRAGSVIVRYTIIPTGPAGSGSCNGSPVNFDLTVNPQPTFDPALSPTPVCSGVNSGVTLGVQAGSVGATTYNINSITFPGLIAGGSNAGIGTGKLANAIFNDVYTNTSNGQLLVTYKIVPVSAAGCLGPEASLILRIDPSPEVADNLDLTVCTNVAGGITLATKGSSTPAVSYNIISRTAHPSLVASGGNVVVPASAVASNYLAGDIFTNLTNNPLTVIYRVEPKSGLNCLGPQKDIVLTIEPTIKATPINNKPNICSTSGNGADPTDIEFISPTVPTAGVITFNYTAVSSLGGQITGFIPALSSLPSGYRITDNLVNNSNGPGFVTYTITPVANGARGGSGCTGTPVPIIVNVEPKPKLITTPSLRTVCEGVSTNIAFTSLTTPSVGVVEYLLVSTVATGGVTGASPNGTVFAKTSTLNDILNNPGIAAETVTYTLRPRINGGAGCIGDDVTFVITVNPRPSITASPQAPICSGDAIDISITADVPLTVSTWTVSAPATVVGASPGAGDRIFQILFNNGNIVETVTYTVTPQASGCAGTPLPIIVQVNPTPKVTGVPTTVTVCHGSSLNIPLASNVAGATFDWVVDDPNGLGVPTTGSGSTITQPMTNTLGFQATLTYTITPTGPPPPGTGCVGASKVMIVTVSPQITAGFLNSPSPDFLCKGSTEYLIFQFGGQPLFNFTYNDGTTTFPVIKKGNVAVIQKTNMIATTTFTITSVTDGLGCTTPFSVPFTVNVGDTDPAFTIISPTATCSPNQVSFQHNQVAGTIYTWRFGDVGDSTYQATTTVSNKVIKHTYTNLSPTSILKYPVTLQTELPAPYPGCFKSNAPQMITIYPNIIVNVLSNKTEICSGETVQFLNQSVGATTQNWTYRIQGQVAETALSSSVNFSTAFTNVSATNPIIYEVIFRANNGNCPTPDAIIPITVYRSVVANFDDGATPHLYVNGGSDVTFTNNSTPVDGAIYNYDWDFGSNAVPPTFSGPVPPVIKYIQPGPKTIVLTASNKANAVCKTTFTKAISIDLPPLIATFLASPSESCFPSRIEVVQANITGDIIEYKVIDQNGRVVANSSAAKPIFEIPASGKYTITLQTSNSLTAQIAVATPQTVTVFPKPRASFLARPEIVFVPDTELQTQNLSTGANQYYWDFDFNGDFSKDEEPKYIYKIEGVYNLALYAQFDHGNGIVCADTLIQKITAKQGGVTKVPNAFTPNLNGPGAQNGPGDSANDVFLPIVKGAEEYNLQIFDRWGNLIFESNSTQIGWDGYNIDGRLLPAGVYVYKLTIRLSDGQRSTQIGDVTMIR